MFALYQQTAQQCSQIVTRAYSTSFSLGIRTLGKNYRGAVYAIYGMVRYADEIVDTFHVYDKQYLLQKFRADTFEAIEQGISLNPILQSFQWAVNTYNIPANLINAFFDSMAMDLDGKHYSDDSYQQYIYGSAEVVGLMCLCVFTNGDREMYNRLEVSARALGAAFQKVNFLRDMESDFSERGRVYFPGVNFDSFGAEAKQAIEADIAADFETAYEGIMQLPYGARAGVLLAYKYYLRLFDRIKGIHAAEIKKTRVRVPDFQKLALLVQTLLQQNLYALLPMPANKVA